MCVLCVEQFSTYSGDGRNDQCKFKVIPRLNGGERWIRTTEALASDLQSDPFDRSGTSPSGYLSWSLEFVVLFEPLPLPDALLP